MRSLSSKSAAAGKDKDRADREADSDADNISKMHKEFVALRKDKKYVNKTLELCRKELKKHDAAWTPPKQKDPAGASTSTPKRGKKHSPAADVNGGGEEGWPQGTTKASGASLGFTCTPCAHGGRAKEHRSQPHLRACSTLPR